MKKVIQIFAMSIAVISMTSCVNVVDPGQEAFMFRPWDNDGVDTSTVYKEGAQLIAPWNDLIRYNVLQQSRNYSSSVMEKNGMDITVDITVNYSPAKYKTPKLHLKHGVGYETSYIDPIVKGAIKNVIGRYTYEEIYSTKREALELELDELMDREFISNYIDYHFCEIADVTLPDNVRKAITGKEEQKQKNQRAKELELEQEYIANATIKKAEGTKQATILEAEGESQYIQLIQKQLARSPQYNEYVKWQGFREGKGSPYGTDNVYGAGTTVVKGLK